MFTMFGIVPVHYFVSCDASATTAAVAGLLLFITGILSIVARRFSPFGWAFLAMFLHSLSMH